MPRAPRTAVAKLVGRLASWLALSVPLLVCALLTGASACAGARDAAPYTLLAPAGDAVEAADLDPLVRDGMASVSDRLGLPWLQPLTVTIAPDRSAFTASFPPEFGMTETQCWMVAWAIADRLTLLSPRAWPTEACEHDPDDRQHLTLLVRHELVHALHGQHNPTRDFTGMDEMGWFVEGLATFASGQLEAEHEHDAAAAIAAGAAPARLADAWSGRYRYGVSGSVVAYLDQRCGRQRLQEMMASTTQPQLLAIAGLTEDELLAAWAAWAAR